jgi:hypothetical protein
VEEIPWSEGESRKGAGLSDMDGFNDDDFGFTEF